MFSKNEATVLKKKGDIDNLFKKMMHHYKDVAKIEKIKKEVKGEVQTKKENIRALKKVISKNSNKTVQPKKSLRALDNIIFHNQSVKKNDNHPKMTSKALDKIIGMKNVKSKKRHLKKQKNAKKNKSYWDKFSTKGLFD